LYLLYKLRWRSTWWRKKKWA